VSEPDSQRQRTLAFTEGAADATGLRVTVVGLGRFGGGIGATQWLASQGAKVTVSDQAPLDRLAESAERVAIPGVELHLGGHDPADFLSADLLVVSPAVPKEIPLLRAAEEAGVPRTSEINLFLRRCQAPVVGITGTVGKSTTTAMIGNILALSRTTHVGGNIGASLLGALNTIGPEDTVVLELSSFQLEDLPLVRVSPRVAAVTNLQPNHLDRHKTFADYAEAKKNIFRFQREDDTLILNRASEELASWEAEAPGKVEYFDPEGPAFELSVPGVHNQANAQAAWVASRAMGATRTEATKALREFGGLPHRLQYLGEVGGVRYYNDSKCTTPQGAIVALKAFERNRVVILVGGYDKGVEFDSLGAALAQWAKHVVVLGDTGRAIADAVESQREAETPSVQEAGSLREAVGMARRNVAPGDVVLLSPACASYGMFDNYEQRGDAFSQLVRSQAQLD
jgi:UDP-N-acetylmuramoylalanine--D-glutamate ligase